MKPLTAVRTFLDETGLDYQESSPCSVSMMVPSSKLVVRTTIACVNDTLVVLITLPLFVSTSRQAEFERVFAEFNKAIEWGQISLDENSVHIVATMGYEAQLVPEQVQLCFEQAYDIAGSHSESILRQVFSEDEEDEAA